MEMRLWKSLGSPRRARSTIPHTPPRYGRGDAKRVWKNRFSPKTNFRISQPKRVLSVTRLRELILTPKTEPRTWSSKPRFFTEEFPPPYAHTHTCFYIFSLGFQGSWNVGVGNHFFLHRTSDCRVLFPWTSGFTSTFTIITIVYYCQANSHRVRFNYSGKNDENQLENSNATEIRSQLLTPNKNNNNIDKKILCMDNTICIAVTTSIEDLSVFRGESIMGR